MNFAAAQSNDLSWLQDNGLIPPGSNLDMCAHRGITSAVMQGPVDLYRGLSGAIFGTVPVALVYFSTYESCKSFLEERGVGKAAAHLSSASLGAILSAFIRVPTDTLKHRTQAYITPNIFVVRTSGLSSVKLHF